MRIDDAGGAFGEDRCPRLCCPSLPATAGGLAHGLKWVELAGQAGDPLVRPAAGLPSLDAIPVDPRDAEREVVAKSLLTLAVFRRPDLNWCRKRDSNPRPHHYELYKSNVPYCHVLPQLFLSL
jgi:hypothetical protein